MASTWSAADKDSAITLSNANLTAAPNAITQTGVRGTFGRTTGRLYIEFKMPTLIGNDGCGIANSSWPFTGGNGLGGDTFSLAYVFTGGQIYVNNAVLSTVAIAEIGRASCRERV